MRSIGYQTDRFARIGFGINTASNVRCGADRVRSRLRTGVCFGRTDV
jgi:hypothetical protein